MTVIFSGPTTLTSRGALVARGAHIGILAEKFRRVIRVGILGEHHREFAAAIAHRLHHPKDVLVIDADEREFEARLAACAEARPPRMAKAAAVWQKRRRVSGWDV